MPGATRLEVGPRESRAGSWVPRYTSPGPTVPATCQGGAVHAPGALRSRESPPMYQWNHHAPRWPSTLPRSGHARASVEAPCSALVINNRGRPHGCINLREPLSSVSGLIATPPLGRVARGAGHGGCAWVTPKRTPPSQIPRTWSARAPPEPSLGESKGRNVVWPSRGTPEHRDSGA